MATSAADTNDPAGLMGKTVKVHSIASKPELNGQLGTAISYLHQQGRYVVQLQPPGPVGSRASLKDSNLAPANYLERTQHTVAEMKHAATTLYNDPQTRAKVRQVYAEAQRRLPPGVKLEHAAGGAVLLIFVIVYMLGITRSIFFGSIICMLCAVALPDILSGAGPKVVARNFPARWREMLVESTGLSWITERMAMSLLVMLLLFFTRALIFKGSMESARSGTSSPYNAPVNGGLSPESTVKWSMEDVYKLGFDDATQGNDYRQSLPVDHDSIGHFVSRSPATVTIDDEDMDWTNYEPSSPPPPPEKNGGFGFGTLMSLFAIGRVVKDMGFTADGTFHPSLLIANVRMMAPWKLGFLGLAIYRVITSFL